MFYDLRSCENRQEDDHFEFLSKTLQVIRKTQPHTCRMVDSIRLLISVYQNDIYH